jgi:hypothetical protein
MHSFSLLLLSNLALFSTRTYACDDCWEWPEDDAVFQDEILSATNTYRAQHNASPLVWNETLAEGADGYVYGCKNYVPYVSVVARRQSLESPEMLSVHGAKSQRSSVSILMRMPTARSIWREQERRIQQPSADRCRMGRGTRVL